MDIDNDKLIKVMEYDLNTNVSYLINTLCKIAMDKKKIKLYIVDNNEK